MDRVDKKTFVNLIGAQLLGPALSPGAIYVASVLESSTDILCIKGNYCPSRYTTTIVISLILAWTIVMLFCAPLHLFFVAYFCFYHSLSCKNCKYTKVFWSLQKQSNMLNKLVRTFGFYNYVLLEIMQEVTWHFHAALQQWKFWRNNDNSTNKPNHELDDTYIIVNAGCL